MSRVPFFRGQSTSRSLEVERQLCGHCAWGYVVRAAEGGEEVVERVLVGDVDGGEVEIDLVAVGVEEVVFAERDVEEIARRDAGRVAGRCCRCRAREC